MIDFSKYRAATSLSEKRRTADEIVSGFKEVGFIYLDKHGIPESTVKHTFQKVHLYPPSHHMLPLPTQFPRAQSSSSSLQKSRLERVSFAPILSYSFLVS